MSDNLVLAGIIGAARGLKGEVFVEVRTDRADEVFEVGSQLHLQSARGDAASAVSPGAFAHVPTIVTVDVSRVHSGRQILHFMEVQTREQAEALRGTHLMTPEVEEEDAWYPYQLEGLEVVALDGEPLGTVSGLAQGTAHDFLLVNHSGTDVMVPFVLAIVPEVSIEEKRVVVDAPEGLFD
ncbi:ribosome maturation factor RimM [Actinomycetaceae bacterium MB13-C1-2]|nr:ribosome maturation factor RimM [Actinomycetaceae bacterium MB13-C1-2]